jgi:hypothetical protein
MAYFHNFTYVFYHDCKTSLWNPIRVQKKRSTRKENRCFHRFVTLDPSSQIWGPIFPRFRGLESRKNLRIFSGAGWAWNNGQLQFPARNAMWFFVGIWEIRKRAFSTEKKVVISRCFWDQKRGFAQHFPISEISQQKNTSIKSPAEGTCRRKSGISAFRGSPQDLSAAWDLSAGWISLVL